MGDILKVNFFRYSFSLSLAFCLAMIVNYYVANTSYFLLPLSAVYVMQTSVGSSFYQGMQRLAWLMIFISIAAIILKSTDFFYRMAHDALIGGTIGIIANLIFFPRKADAEFREHILPIVKAYNDYFSQLIDQLLQHDEDKLKNVELENALIQLPDWVYERGFNNRLQAGYRFFLMKLEQISDVLFSMHHLVRHEYDKELIAKIRPLLLTYVENVNQFFLAIITVVELKKLIDKPGDLEREMDELQKQFFAIMPSSLELLDMQRDYVYLAAFIYNLKDLRKLLLQLGSSLNQKSSLRA